MPLFYLHIDTGDEVLDDPEGIERADLAAALAEAHHCALSLMTDDVLSAGCSHVPLFCLAGCKRRGDFIDAMTTFHHQRTFARRLPNVR